MHRVQTARESEPTVAASKSTTAPATDLLDEADDLFGNEGASSDDDFAAADDLLDEVNEDDAEAWNPTERDEKISGVIVKVGETRSDFAPPGTNAMVPTVTIENREGKFRIIGFGSVLRRELEDLKENGSLEIGNLFAAKYWGEKPIKKGQFAGKNYKHYSVAAKKPAAAVKG